MSLNESFSSNLSYLGSVELLNAMLFIRKRTIKSFEVIAERSMEYSRRPSILQSCSLTYKCNMDTVIFLSLIFLCNSWYYFTDN